MSDIVPQYGVSVINDSGKVIPPNSVVVVTFVERTPQTDLRDAEMIHHVTQYGCGLPGNVMVTGDASIPPTYKGRAYLDPFMNVAINMSIGVPVPGEEWGPQDGTWTVSRGGKGFIAQGYASGSTDIKSLFLRNYTRAAATVCSSSSSSTSSQSGNSDSSASSSSVSGSSSTSTSSCGCITVVTSASCSGGALSVTYGQARGCC